MRYTIFDTPGLTRVLRGIAWIILRLGGWAVDGKAPDLPKYVVIFAPHTSNWDLPMVVVYALVLRVNVLWLGKSTLFRGPLDWMFRFLGGLPIDRSKAHNVVGQTIKFFRDRDRLAIGIAPAGTRKHVGEWKTGFYHIAKGAGVPILLSYIDYGRKQGGFGPLIAPSGDMDNEIDQMQKFYKGITGKRRVASETGS